MMRRLLIPLVLLLAACDTPAPAATTASPSRSATVTTTATTTTAPVPTTTVRPSTTAATPLNVPDRLAGFVTRRIGLDGGELLVAVADSSDLRQQGLMGIEDLGDLDGMLFVFESDSSGGFWMKETLLPLDIAFFDELGAFVDGFEMEPCTTPECPIYRPDGSYRYALERPAGHMPEVVGVLELDWDE